MEDEPPSGVWGAAAATPVCGGPEVDERTEAGAQVT